MSSCHNFKFLHGRLRLLEIAYCIDSIDGVDRVESLMLAKPNRREKFD